MTHGVNQRNLVVAVPKVSVHRVLVVCNSLEVLKSCSAARNSVSGKKVDGKGTQKPVR